jgi:NADPH:quinone reductase-like Zn-dependent oxidoreductase
MIIKTPLPLIDFHENYDCENCEVSSHSQTRAVLCTRYGGPEVLEYREDWSVRGPRAHEIQVRVLAASVNPIDIHMRRGYGRGAFEWMRTSRPTFPFVLGRYD